MPRQERASSRNGRPRPRVVQAPQPPALASPTEHKLKADDFYLPSSPDIAKPPMREIPEFFTMMLEAIWAEPEGDRSSVKTLMKHFKGRVLSNGRKIGRVRAEYMARCCQAAIMMDGGRPPD